MKSKTTRLSEKIHYDSVNDKGIMYFIDTVRQGIDYSSFLTIAGDSPLSINEWSNILHISERTMQRYKKEQRTFSALQSEKILQIALLTRMGTGIFGNREKYSTWLEMENIALGNSKPKDLLDNTFGINMLEDELIRIEHGILA